MVLLHLARERGDLAPIIHVVSNWRGRDRHDALSRCIGPLPRTLHSQLDLPVCLIFTGISDGSEMLNHLSALITEQILH